MFVQPGDPATLISPQFNGILGDVNQDGFVAGDGTGTVDSDDVSAFVAGWRTTDHGTILEMVRHGDLNLNGITDLEDWSIFNEVSPSMGLAIAHSLRVQDVPEPRALMLSVCGILCFMSLSRCRR